MTTLLECLLNGILIVSGILAIGFLLGLLYFVVFTNITSYLLDGYLVFARINKNWVAHLFTIIVLILLFALFIVIGCNSLETCPYWFCIG